MVDGRSHPLGWAVGHQYSDTTAADFTRAQQLLNPAEHGATDAIGEAAHLLCSAFRNVLHATVVRPSARWDAIMRTPSWHTLVVIRLAPPRRVVAACVFAMVDVDATGARALICPAFVVASEHRRKGYGAMLCRLLRELARDCSHVIVTCSRTSANPAEHGATDAINIQAGV